MSETSDARVHGLLAQLALEWLAERTGASDAELSPSGSSHLPGRLGDARVAIAVEPVASATPSEGWQRGLERFAARLSPPVGGALVWVPAGAALPDAEPAATAVADALERALRSLAPGEVGEAALPIEIRMSRRDESGAYVSAFGGLAQHWARFTDRVQGYFQIDATELHRLPGPPKADYLDELVDRLVEASKMLSVGAGTAIEALDHWRVQRMTAGDGIGVAAIPPEDDSESGAPLRRRLRAVLRDQGARLAAEPVDARVLLFYGHYPSPNDEPVGAALRGQDPSLFGGLDLVLLAADGAVRVLVDITRKPLLQPAPPGGSA